MPTPSQYHIWCRRTPHTPVLILFRDDSFRAGKPGTLDLMNVSLKTFIDKASQGPLPARGRKREKKKICFGAFELEAIHKTRATFCRTKASTIPLPAYSSYRLSLGRRNNLVPGWAFRSRFVAFKSWSQNHGIVVSQVRYKVLAKSELDPVRILIHDLETLLDSFAQHRLNWCQLPLPQGYA